MKAVVLLITLSSFTACAFGGPSTAKTSKTQKIVVWSAVGTVAAIVAYKATRPKETPTNNWYSLLRGYSRPASMGAIPSVPVSWGQPPYPVPLSGTRP